MFEIIEPTGFLILQEPINFKVEGIRDYDKDNDGDYIKTIEVFNEQPTATIIIDKSILLRDEVDTSLIDTSDYSKIQFKLTAKEDVIDKADNSIIYKAGTEIGIYNLTKEGTLKIEGLPLGIYELLEVSIIPGLVLSDTIYTVEFILKDNTTKVYTETLEIENETTIFEFSKKSITGEDELVDAKLKVLDEENNIVDSWTSSDKPHKIEGLEAGKSFKLVEEIAPNGYVIANEIEFTVSNTNEIQKVTMIDKIVEVLKVDIDGNPVENSTLQVLDKDKNIVDEWITTKEVHRVCGLREGEIYILHEEIVAEGFVKATDIEFTVTLEKVNQKIEMIDKIVLVSKIDKITGEILTDCHLKIIDEENNVIDSWISTNEPHQVIGLEENKKYWLIEDEAKYGYLVAEPIEFEVTEYKQTQEIVMEDMPILKTIRVLKIDSETKEIIKDKFIFGLYEDEDCTKLIKKVKSDKATGTVLFEDIRFGTVFLKELSAPKGYQLSDKVVKIEINHEGTFADGELLEDDNSICTLTYENKLIPKIQTGNEVDYVILFGSIIISLLGAVIGIVILIRKNQKNK